MACWGSGCCGEGSQSTGQAPPWPAGDVPVKVQADVGCLQPVSRCLSQQGEKEPDDQLKDEILQGAAQGACGDGGGRSLSASTAAAGGGRVSPPAPSRWEGTPGKQSPSQQGPGEIRGNKMIPRHPLKRIEQAAWGTAHVLSPSYLQSDFLLLLLLKPLQRAARFQEHGSSKHNSLWLPAGLGRICV